MAPKGRKPRKTTPLADSSVATSGAPLFVRLPSTLGSIPLSAMPISDRLSELLVLWYGLCSRWCSCLCSSVHNSIHQFHLVQCVRMQCQCRCSQGYAVLQSTVI
jgi:hypothetical protein